MAIICGKGLFLVSVLLVNSLLELTHGDDFTHYSSLPTIPEYFKLRFPKHTHKLRLKPPRPPLEVEQPALPPPEVEQPAFPPLDGEEPALTPSYEFSDPPSPLPDGDQPSQMLIQQIYY